MNIILVKRFMAQRLCVNKDGYILLLAILVVGAVGLAVSISLLLLGLSSSRNSLALEQSSQAKALVNACAEEALQQIRSSTGYIGSGSLTLGQGNCSYAVTNLGGENRGVAVSATVGTIVRRATVSVTAISPQIIASWQEGP